MAVNRARYFGIFAGAGCIVLVAALAIVTWINAPKDDAPPSTPTSVASPRPTESAAHSSPEPTAEADPAPTAEGWVTAPVTTDPETFGVAMLEAANTFNAAASEHYEFVRYLESWLQLRPAGGPGGTTPEDFLKDSIDLLGLYAVIEDDKWADLALAETTSSVMLSNVTVEPAPEQFPEQWDITADVTVSRTSRGYTTEESIGEWSVRVACVIADDGTAQPCYAVRWFPQV